MHINKISDITKLANVTQGTNSELLVNYENNIPQGNITIIETVDGEITNVSQSKNPQSIINHYKNGGISKNGRGKPSETNYTKYAYARDDINDGKKVELYISSVPKDEILDNIYEQDGRYPSKNYQKNKEKIPQKYIDEMQKRRNSHI